MAEFVSSEGAPTVGRKPRAKGRCRKLKQPPEVPGPKNPENSPGAVNGEMEKPGSWRVPVIPKNVRISPKERELWEIPTDKLFMLTEEERKIRHVVANRIRQRVHANKRKAEGRNKVSKDIQELQELDEQHENIKAECEKLQLQVQELKALVKEKISKGLLIQGLFAVPVERKELSECAAASGLEVGFKLPLT